MRYPTDPLWNASAFNYDGDISGAPRIVIGSDESIYMALAVRGSHPATGPTQAGGFDIAICKLTAAGEIIWMQLFPKLNTTTDETEPYLAIGAEDELYVTYVTRGSTPGNVNMDSAFTFCPQVCTARAPEDIAIARINTRGTPSVAWVIQNGIFNSCNADVSPTIGVDSKNGLIYITVEVIGNSQCNNPSVYSGERNLLTACFTTGGSYKWSDVVSINTAGKPSRNADIAVDLYGNVYVAYETTVKGYDNQVEVIKYRTTANTYVVDWKLSQKIDLRAQSINPRTLDTINKSPSIVCDPKGRTIMGFVTNGVIPGGTRSTYYDYINMVETPFELVLIGFDSDGKVIWLGQSNAYNKAAYAYNEAYTPYLNTDIYGNLYVSLNVRKHISGIDKYGVWIYKLSPSTGASDWSYTTTANMENAVTYTSYTFAGNDVHSTLPYALTPYERVYLAKYKGLLYVTIRTPNSSPPPTNNCIVYAFGESLYFENYGSFGFIDTVKSGCGCGTRTTCGC
jgi:hypothetical protein